VKKGERVRAWDCIFAMEKERKTINWEQIFFVHHRIISAGLLAIGYNV
jgi:hypothetical protein